MSKGKLGEVLEEVKRPVDVMEEEEYRILGIRWYAEGAWVKKECVGSEIKAAKLYRVDAGDLIYNRLFAWKGSFAVIPQDLDGCYVSNEFPAFRVRDGNANIHYIFMLLSQPALWEAIERESAGVASISRKRLKVRDFLELELPLPSRRRQVEILDRYARLRREVKELTKRVMKSISDVDELRQTVLQLAVMGRLVPQDPADEPASELIKRIQAEKQRLIAEGAIRRPKPLPPIGPKEVPHELPASWCWTRLGEIALKVTDGTHHSPPSTSHGDYLYVTAKNIKPEGVDLTDVTYVSKDRHEEIFARCDPSFGDLLYIKDGATTGVATINNLSEPFSMLSSVALAKLPATVFNRYLLHVFRSPFFYSMMRGDMAGIAITRVTLTKLNRALVPLAPLPEQKRIVAEVDQLMTLCDDLEAKLQKAQQDADNLLDAIVHELVNGSGGNSP